MRIPRHHCTLATHINSMERRGKEEEMGDYYNTTHNGYEKDR